MKKIKTEITHHNNDIIMKTMAENFKDKTLAFFGLETAKITGLMPTVLPVVEAKENRTDLVFTLADNTLLHLEFQTKVSTADLKRFLLYDARIINRDNEGRIVNTAVIYSGRITIAPNKLNMGSLQYNITNVYMKEYDGDAEYSKLHHKIVNNQPLDETDLLKLIFLPMMNSKDGEEEMALKAAELAKQTDEKTKTIALASIIVISDKFMSVENKKRLLEVLEMTQIEQWIREEGREEGRKEGKEKKAHEIAKAALREGADVEFVVKITGLDRKTILQLKKDLH